MFTDYGDDFNFGEGTYDYSSELDALQFYNTNVDGMTISLTEDTNLYFYISDTNSIDNLGSVTLEVAVVPEPISSALFLIGGTALGFRHFRKRKMTA